MKRVDDFRLRFGKHELVPIMIGGMGVDISTAELALEAARLGGVGHISDAMLPTVADRRYDTDFVKTKLTQYKYNLENSDKTEIKFDLGQVAESSRLHVQNTMDAKRGSGMIFLNVMEKLTMNAPKETLKVRLDAALSAGIDGITCTSAHSR
jgi:nitronate monooxygenase